jgi:hypothetical protein
MSGVVGCPANGDISCVSQPAYWGGRMDNLSRFYPPEKAAPAVADAGRKKPRRPGRGKSSGIWRVLGEDVPGVCESGASDRRATGLGPVLSTGKVKGAVPAVADGAGNRIEKAPPVRAGRGGLGQEKPSHRNGRANGV